MFETLPQIVTFFGILVLTALVFASRFYLGRFCLGRFCLGNLSLKPFAIAAVLFVALSTYLELITAIGLLALAIYAALIVGYRTFSVKNHRLFIWLFGIALGIMSLAMAMHAIPGFNNVSFAEHPSLMIEGTAKLVYLNLDKAAVGLGLLVAVACFYQSHSEDKSQKESRYTIKQSLQQLALLAPLTLIPVLLYIYLTGIGEWNLQFNQTIMVIMLVNLLFTCVAEEAFFRLLIQRPISKRFGQYAGIFASAAIFGLAHLGAGTHFAVGATLAGIGYAFIFAKTNRIEASILLHWIVNLALTVSLTIYL